MIHSLGMIAMCLGRLLWPLRARPARRRCVRGAPDATSWRSSLLWCRWLDYHSTTFRRICRLLSHLDRLQTWIRQYVRFDCCEVVDDNICWKSANFCFIFGLLGLDNWPTVALFVFLTILLYTPPWYCYCTYVAASLSIFTKKTFLIIILYDSCWSSSAVYLSYSNRRDSSLLFMLKLTIWKANINIVTLIDANC